MKLRAESSKRHCHLNNPCSGSRPLALAFFPLLLLVSAAAFSTATASAADGAISINFVGLGTAMGTQETAGVIAKPFWNNATGASNTAGLGLVDETGSATAAIVQWTADNGWALPMNDQPGNVRMMIGYLDTANADPTTVTVSGLSAGTYDIYVYADASNVSTTKTATYQIADTGVAVMVKPMAASKGIVGVMIPPELGRSLFYDDPAPAQINSFNPAAPGPIGGTTPSAIAATSMLATGILDGKAPVTITTGTSANLGTTYNGGYTFNQEVTAGAGVTYTLPTTAAGKQYCVENSIVSGTGALDTGVITVYPPSGSYVILAGVQNTIGGGGTHGVVSTGAAANSACFIAIDWTVYTQSGT